MEKFFNVTVITQNIDNLHERAGSSHIIHLHGELTKVTSSWQPNNPAYIKELSRKNMRYIWETWPETVPSFVRSLYGLVNLFL